MVNVDKDCAACDDYAYCRGLCKKHYTRMAKAGAFATAVLS
jgi:radical SAM protein with 4Fe4S-binding SPASM domain